MTVTWLFSGFLCLNKKKCFVLKKTRLSKYLSAQCRFVEYMVTRTKTERNKNKTRKNRHCVNLLVSWHFFLSIFSVKSTIIAFICTFAFKVCDIENQSTNFLWHPWILINSQYFNRFKELHLHVHVTTRKAYELQIVPLGWKQLEIGTNSTLSIS